MKALAKLVVVAALAQGICGRPEASELPCNAWCRSWIGQDDAALQHTYDSGWEFVARREARDGFGPQHGSHNAGRIRVSREQNPRSLHQRTVMRASGASNAGAKAGRASRSSQAASIPHLGEANVSILVQTPSEKAESLRQIHDMMQNTSPVKIDLSGVSSPVAQSRSGP